MRSTATGPRRIMVRFYSLRPEGWWRPGVDKINDKATVRYRAVVAVMYEEQTA